jgi:hypothetical protein
MLVRGMLSGYLNSMVGSGNKTTPFLIYAGSVALSALMLI